MISLPIIHVAVIVFGFLVFTSLIIAAYVNFQKSMKRYEQRVLEKTRKELEDVFIFFSPEQFLYLNMASVFGCMALSMIFIPGNLVMLPIAALIGYFLPKIILRKIQSQRLLKFDEQLVDGLDSMSNSMKAGLTLSQAFGVLVDQMQPPISQEFGLMLKQNRFGVPLDEALSRVSKRVKSKYLNLAVTSLLIGRKAGGNIPKILEEISTSIREISRLEGKLDSMTSQGKLQGLILCSMPLIVGGIVYWMDDSMILPLLHDPLGWAIDVVIVFFNVIGGVFIYKIVSAEV